MTQTRIKFCGMVRKQDLDHAVSLRVDAVGFVFYPRSPRFLSLDQAQALRAHVPSWMRAVGLFVNAERENIAAHQASLGLDILQFHGDESEPMCVERAGATPYWRAVRMRGEGDLLESWANFPSAQALLLDHHSDGYGGSGRSFDWNWVRPEKLPQSPHRPVTQLIMSGGLTADSVGQAIERVKPLYVDVSSGIQGTDPRTKDADRMTQFVQRVVETDARVFDNQTGTGS